MNALIQHTPGPWRVGDAGYTVFGPPNGKLSPAIIANVGRGSFPNARTIANARLIAAAPDLLAWLERVIDCHVPGINPLSDAAILGAREIVAKVKGEA